jgi:hypothetical protein
MRVDFTRRRLIENKTMRVESTRMCVESTRYKSSIQETKNGADACRAKVYVYYNEYKVIF